MNNMRDQNQRTISMTDAPTIGDRIRAWRTSRGLSREALAAMLGVSTNAVWNWESAAAKPSSARILELALERLEQLLDAGVLQESLYVDRKAKKPGVLALRRAVLALQELARSPFGGAGIDESDPRRTHRLQELDKSIKKRRRNSAGALTGGPEAHPF